MEEATAELRLAAQLATHAAQALPPDSSVAAFYHAAAAWLVVEADCHETIPRINGAIGEGVPGFPLAIYVSTLGPALSFARALVAHIQAVARDPAEEGTRWPFTTTI